MCKGGAVEGQKNHFFFKASEEILFSFALKSKFTVENLAENPCKNANNWQLLILLTHDSLFVPVYGWGWAGRREGGQSSLPARLQDEIIEVGWTG